VFSHQTARIDRTLHKGFLALGHLKEKLYLNINHDYLQNFSGKSSVQTANSFRSFHFVMAQLVPGTELSAGDKEEAQLN
jgi:hypothetical protein